MPSLTIDAPAKVNLCLHVLSRRADGYHELLTLMQPLDLADRLELTTGTGGIAFTCSDPALAGGDNLVVRAARAWYEAAGLAPGVAIHLDKRIPVAAGLGGGSSDAAATLLGLNALHGGRLAPETLVGLATRLGADVPFFLAGCTALCRGIGEKVEPWPKFPKLCYAMVNIGITVSTAEVYHLWDRAWTNQCQKSTIRCSVLPGNNMQGLLFNDLETVTLGAHPRLDTIKTALVEEGAEGVLMSGSGPTIFGVFDNMADAVRAASRLGDDTGWWTVACQGLHNLDLD